MTPRVAILGTGRMGSAFAHRLSALHPTVWNRTRATADRLRVGRVVDTAAEAVAEADIVITSVTGASALLNVFSGLTGALSAASGQLFIEMSTAGPDVVQELADSLRDTGSSLIDAPVLGSPAVVTSGGAAILVGGAPADMERGRQVLEMLGEVRLVGPLGSGARLKLIGNSMLATLTLEAAELQVAGEAAGLDPSQVFWAVSRLAPGLSGRQVGYVERRHEPTLFAVRDLEKDLKLALDLFSETRSQTPLTAKVQSLIGEIGPSVAELDITAVISRYDGTLALPPATD